MAALAYLKETLSNVADDVRTEEFSHVGYDGATYEMTNVIASFNPTATTRILLCAHWDTRPRSDADRDPGDRDKPILGANDGGSGVGVLLELARVMKEHPPEIGVDIVLFDGEDYGDSHVDGLDQYFLGAKHFAKSAPPSYRPAFGILLDIVGDKEAVFRRERNSDKYASRVVDRIWRAAAFLGLDRFRNEVGGAIDDDHIPLNRVARIPTIDIIDIDVVGGGSTNPRRNYWHTSDDTIENIGEETLGDVGRLLTYVVYRLVPHDLAASTEEVVQ